MFVDAAVIVDILNKEPGWEELESSSQQRPGPPMSLPSSCAKRSRVLRERPPKTPTRIPNPHLT
jgi:uncharacterized protein with PIN domain